MQAYGIGVSFADFFFFFFSCWAVGSSEKNFLRKVTGLQRGADKELENCGGCLVVVMVCLTLWWSSWRRAAGDAFWAAALRMFTEVALL